MKNEVAAVIHDGLWGLKFFIVAGLFVGSMWIPNSSFIFLYMRLARWISVGYLIY